MHRLLLQIRERHMAEAHCRVRTFYPLPCADAPVEGTVRMPPLLKAYIRLGDRAVAPFVGDDDFLRHLWRILREPALRVDVIVPDALPHPESRDALAEAARRAIASSLALPEKVPTRASRTPRILRREAATR